MSRTGAMVLNGADQRKPTWRSTKTMTTHGVNAIASATSIITLSHAFDAAAPQRAGA